MSVTSLRNSKRANQRFLGTAIPTDRYKHLGENCCQHIQSLFYR